MNITPIKVLHPIANLQEKTERKNTFETPEGHRAKSRLEGPIEKKNLEL